MKKSSESWRIANPEKHRASVRKSARANPEAVKASQANWLAANPDYARQADKDRAGQPGYHARKATMVRFPTLSVWVECKACGADFPKKGNAKSCPACRQTSSVSD